MKLSRTVSGCSTLGLALATLCLPTLAFGACQDVRDRIAQNIESNGVEPMGYSLEVIPTADADQAEGQIVGHCDNNQYQIVYKRHYRHSSAETMEDSSADEDEIDGAPSPATSDTSSEMPSASSHPPETSSSVSGDTGTSMSESTQAPSGQNNASDSRRVQTSDMPVDAETR
ncbi:Protein of unknown function [Kushneria avicenniae]|uniref:DUF1161 domain-containing protein n=1 Tax=Kushneria avicenniae TaxID=402385 RepID=A0A1I1FQ97_9GAMM|nr:DUF1161 domain-containing protein [Kushneria avicenniae]SFB99253.1 Protein of unknown function [Kushneria avicenniae]